MYFFLTATATTETYTLSLHDALPIFEEIPAKQQNVQKVVRQLALLYASYANDTNLMDEDSSTEPLLEHAFRSEEHTSELQSLTNLVCRLLLEKKKKRHKETFYTRHR